MSVRHLISGASHKAARLRPSPNMNETPIAVVAAKTPEAVGARDRLLRRYSHVSPERAKVIVALGGDGFMLETLRSTLDRDVAVYGMNLGSVGFLMNQFRAQGLPGRIARADRVILHPLE